MQNKHKNIAQYAQQTQYALQEIHKVLSNKYTMCTLTTHEVYCNKYGIFFLQHNTQCALESNAQCVFATNAQYTLQYLTDWKPRQICKFAAKLHIQKPFKYFAYSHLKYPPYTPKVSFWNKPRKVIQEMMAKSLKVKSLQFPVSLIFS